MPKYVIQSVLIEDINDWLKTEEENETIIPLINQSETLSELCNSVIREYIPKQAIDPEMNWRIMDKLTQDLEDKATRTFIIQDVKNQTRSRFDSKEVILYKIRRNFFEVEGVFKTGLYEVFIDYNRPRTTVNNLILWSEKNDLASDAIIFLVTYLVLYLSTDALLYPQSDLLRAFWKNKETDYRASEWTLDEPQTSWVVHPLTLLDDEEYLTSVGIDETKISSYVNEAKRHQEILQVLYNKRRTLFATIKVFCFDVITCLRTIENLAKLHESLSYTTYNTILHQNTKKIQTLIQTYKQIKDNILTLTTPDDHISRIIITKFKEIGPYCLTLFGNHIQK